MSTPDPLRGEVWDVRLPHVGEHPAVVLSVNAMNQRLGHVVVAVVTGTQGPAPTHVALDGAAGLTRYDESYVNVTDVVAVARPSFRRRRGLCAPAEMSAIGERLRLYLGL